VSVELIVKFGYVPVIVVAPPWVSATIWSGAVFEKTVPVRARPLPAE